MYVGCTHLYKRNLSFTRLGGTITLGMSKQATKERRRNHPKLKIAGLMRIALPDVESEAATRKAAANAA